MKAALRLEQLSKEYAVGDQSVLVLKGLDLEVPEGDYVAIMGPSGSGKSTLLNILGCLDRPTAGRFLLGGEDVAQLDDEALAARRGSRLGFVFQSYNLVPQLTVLENIEAPLYYQNQITPENRARCRELATRVGLGDRLHHRPPQLSGGQQQRAGIARSLVNDPRYILADEPTGNLDSETTREILTLLDQLNAEGKTIVLVTHEDEVAQHARRIVRLRDGIIHSDERRRPPAGALVEAVNTAGVTGATGSKAEARLLHAARTLQMGLKSLRVHPLRSALTMLGIFIGVASVIWLLAIGEGISAKAQEQISQLGANNLILTTQRPPPQGPAAPRRARFGVTERDYETLRATVMALQDVVAVRQIEGKEVGFGPRRSVARLVGTMPAYAQLNRLKIESGRFFADPELKLRAKTCVLAPQLAEELFGYEEALGQSIHVGSDYYSVVGLLQARPGMAAIQGMKAAEDFSRDVYIPLTTLQTMVYDPYGRTEDGIPILSHVTLSFRHPEHVMDAATVVRRTLDRFHDQEDYTLTVPLELLQQARNTRLLFIAMMGMIAAISLLVGGIGIMNIMLATVTERTREIGIRRAIGARRRDIIRQFLVETIVLATAGGFGGVLGGLACGPMFRALLHLLTTSFPAAIGALPESIRGMTPILVPWSLPLAFVISVVIGIVFGVYPAQRAAAMNPIEALRHAT